jgi:hypothetical protein
MGLKLERLDAYYTGKTSCQYGIFDEVTGKCIGTVNIDRYIGKRRVARTVQLFDKKYSGSFDTHAECVAFVKGVEAVLNHTMKPKVAAGTLVAMDLDQARSSIMFSWCRCPLFSPVISSAAARASPWGASRPSFSSDFAERLSEDWGIQPLAGIERPIRLSILQAHPLLAGL